MGLFNRLFGKNKQETSLDTEIKAEEETEILGSMTEQVEKPSVKLVVEEKKETVKSTQEQKEDTSLDSSFTFKEDPEVLKSRREQTEKNLKEPAVEEKKEVIDSAQEKVAEISTEKVIEKKYEKSLEKTSRTFGERFNALLANFRTVDEEFFENLEETLILSDVGAPLALEISEELRQEAKLANAKSKEELRGLIIEKMVDKFGDEAIPSVLNLQNDLTVFLFVGVNGVGKTTTIGKLAARYEQEGKKVLLAAADTFRAGAIDQLVEWADRAAVEIVTKPTGSDPASVVFDALAKAKNENYDILLIDTAGRLQNKDNLMKELEKIGRIIKRELPDAPHETLLTLDATTGQNAIQQAKEFSQVTPVTGIVLTKLDGSAKGGIVLSIVQSLGIPVKLVGLGEKLDDLQDFDTASFIRGLFKGLI